MALPKTYAKKQAKAKRRSRLNAKARHQRQQQDAQRTINALHQALHDLGLPDQLVAEIEARLKAQKKLLSGPGRINVYIFGKPYLLIFQV